MEGGGAVGRRGGTGGQEEREGVGTGRRGWGAGDALRLSRYFFCLPSVPDGALGKVFFNFFLLLLFLPSVLDLSTRQSFFFIFFLLLLF